MLNLPIPPELLNSLRKQGWKYPDDQLLLQDILIYLLDRCMLLRNPRDDHVLITDDAYSLTTYGMNLTEIANVVEWYVPHILSELTLSNIDTPYIVGVYQFSFTIMNKKEYT